LKLYLSESARRPIAELQFKCCTDAFELQYGRCLIYVQGHQGCVNSLAWNAQGTLLISGSDDTRVCAMLYTLRPFVHSLLSYLMMQYVSCY
jgi:WD40 repeat protein